MCNEDKKRNGLNRGLAVFLLILGVLSVLMMTPVQPAHALVSTGEFTITGSLPGTDVQPPTGEITPPGGGTGQHPPSSGEHDNGLPQTDNREWPWVNAVGWVWLIGLLIIWLTVQRRRADETT